MKKNECIEHKIVICCSGYKTEENAVDFMTRQEYLKRRIFGSGYREYGICLKCGEVFEDSRYKK